MSFILGLTGSIATGKSTVSKVFKQAGVPVVDADVGAREVVKPGTEGLKRIEQAIVDHVAAQRQIVLTALTTEEVNQLDGLLRKLTHSLDL